MGYAMNFARIVSVLVAAFLAACTPSSGHEAIGPGGGRPAPEVSVMTVTPHAVPLSFEYVGQAAGSREVEVRARVTGILLSHNFKEGAAVKQGQSLFTPRPRAFRVALARAEADVAAAQARLEQAGATGARLKPLYGEKAVSQREYDDAASAATIAARSAGGAGAARPGAPRPRLHQGRVAGSGVAGRALQSDGTLVSGPDVLLAP